MGQKMQVMPVVCPFSDDDSNRLNLFISMPGVKKEDISVELNESHLLVSAPTEDIDYVTSMTFCRPVRYDEVETAYECNLVKITVPFKNGAQEVAMAKFPEQTGFSVRTLPQPGK